MYTMQKNKKYTETMVPQELSAKVENKQKPINAYNEHVGNSYW